MTRRYPLRSQKSSRWLAFVLMVVVVLGAIPFAHSQAQDLALAQFETCGFGAEYHDTDSIIRKWAGEVKVFFAENYTNEDLAFFHNFLLQLAGNAPDFPPVSIVNREQDANVVVYYVRLDKMGQYLENYVEGNWGYFYLWYNGQQQITRVNIGIAYDVTTQAERNHLLMEEFIGGSGLSNDHYLDENSILYQGWTNTQQLTDADWRMLRMLYHPSIKPGMTKKQVLPIAEKIP